MKLKFLVVLFFALVLLNGCLSIKIGGVKSGKNLYETFFVGEAGTQYFLKPFYFYNKQKESVIIDFTFRYKDVIKDSVMVNFTIKHANLFKTIDAAVINNDSMLCKLNNMVLLYNKKDGKYFLSRFSSKCALKDLDQLFLNDQWKIEVKSKLVTSQFYHNKKSRKKINKLNSELFVLLR